MLSPTHDSLDCRQRYIDTSYFSHAADDLSGPSWIGHDCAVLTEYYLQMYITYMNLHEKKD
jgi:hypothetical protein